MNKFFTLTIISLLLTAATVSANDEVSVLLRRSFENEFAGARYVNWFTIDEGRIYKAVFWLDQDRFTAYFSEKGDLLLTGRAITEAQLPLLVDRKIKTRFRKYKLVLVTECIANGETSYVIDMQNEKSKIVLRSDASGQMSFFKKVKK